MALLRKPIESSDAVGKARTLNETCQTEKNVKSLNTPGRFVPDPLEPTGLYPDLVCFSHLRWDSVFQRPHHLLTRFARERRVFYVEEPVMQPGLAYLQVSHRDGGVRVATPYLPDDLDGREADALLMQLLSSMIEEYKIRDFISWYYTPMALRFSRHLNPLVVVYDCMDELSAFAFAPSSLRELEAELLRRAHLVFTGGQSLYESKRDRHPRVYPFPSSVETAHFGQARLPQQDPPDQASIPHPRLGFFGVIDERMDLDLVREVAKARPDWHLVFIGPVVKINAARLPRRGNIHYLGAKSYTHLPQYLAGWDVAVRPFARNESTRFISPTKTPEYLAGGKPVVSTSIHDVVHPYADQGLVRVADDVPAFVAAVEASLTENQAAGERLARVDAFLAKTSWDRTWSEMDLLIQNEIAARREAGYIPAPAATSSLAVPTLANLGETELENV